MPINHGTLTGYTAHACRCEDCTRAMRDYDYRRRDRRVSVNVDQNALSDLLNELFPLGLTDECPARRGLLSA